MFFADEKPELSTNMWHDFNDKNQEWSMILDMFFFANEKPKLSTIVWDFLNDKKSELTLICLFVFADEKP